MTTKEHPDSPPNANAEQPIDTPGHPHSSKPDKNGSTGAYGSPKSVSTRTLAANALPSGHVSSETTCQASPTLPNPPRLTAINKLQKAAAKEVRNCEAHAQELRNDHIAARAQYWATARNQKAEGIVKALQAAEAALCLLSSVASVAAMAPRGACRL
ncbi:hypothetical protein ACA910_011094 [Epithemia clementina (nom. ined.)]